MESLKLLALMSIFWLIVATACQYSDLGQNLTTNNTDRPGPIRVDRGTNISEEDFDVIITGVEGELIKLNPKAIDPDGDAISYLFSDPFDEQGRWSPRMGDAGDYPITVRAFDGINYTSQNVLIRVFEANKAPIIDCPERVQVTETEEVVLDCSASDPEGGEVSISYSGFMTTPRYKTNFEDAGEHTVRVTASDEDGNDATDTVNVIVNDLNRPPEVDLDFETPVRAIEGDIVTIKPNAVDPDGDDLKIEYSEPFSRDGVWRTEIGDAGTFEASIVVSDGKDFTRKVFQVIIGVRNTAPNLFVANGEEDIFVDEGDIIDLDIGTFDREEDDVSVTITGYMTQETKTASYEDAWPDGCDTKGCTAEYGVTVIATDGRMETVREITIHVTDKNRPPIFKVPA